MCVVCVCLCNAPVRSYNYLLLTLTRIYLDQTCMCILNLSFIVYFSVNIYVQNIYMQVYASI